MKKNIAIHGLMLMLAFFSALTASAWKVTYEWDIPGSVIIRLDTPKAEPLDIPADATRYDVVCDDALNVYVQPAAGYMLTTILEPTDGDPIERKPSVNATYGQFWSKFWGESSASKVEGKAVKVGCEKVIRNDIFTIEVVNGAKAVSASFSELVYNLELTNGTNSVRFNPEYDKTLVLSAIPGNGISQLYYVAVNGEKQEVVNVFSKYYQIENVKPGDVVTVRAYENGEVEVPEVVLTVSLPAGMEDCIFSIYDYTAAIFREIDENGRLAVPQGTELGLTFKDDYEFEKFMLDGEDITSSYSETLNRLRFVVDKEATLTVAGAPIDYGTEQFTVNVLNPEGVVLYHGGYLQNPTDLSAISGTPFDGEVEIGGHLLNSENTRVYTLDVTKKNPRVWATPKEGYYISTMQAPAAGGNFEIISSASSDEGVREFYVVALPFEYAGKFVVNVTGTRRLRLQHSSVLSQLWGNPSEDYEIAEGENKYEFVPGYHDPFTLRTLENFDNFQVFVDGEAGTPDDNGAYQLTPYVDSENPGRHTVVTVFADGTAMGRTYPVTLSTTGIEAEFFFGGSHTAATLPDTGKRLLVNTPVAIRPSDRNCMISRNGEVVHSPLSGINGLNEDGEYVNVVGSKNVYKVAPDTLAAIESIEEGATDHVTVVGIDGRVIIEKAPASVIESLDKGIYIVNGKKIIIK